MEKNQNLCWRCCVKVSGISLLSCYAKVSEFLCWSCCVRVSGSVLTTAVQGKWYVNSLQSLCGSCCVPKPDISLLKTAVWLWLLVLISVCRSARILGSLVYQYVLDDNLVADNLVNMTTTIFRSLPFDLRKISLSLPSQQSFSDFLEIQRKSSALCLATFLRNPVLIFCLYI